MLGAQAICNATLAVYSPGSRLEAISLWSFLLYQRAGQTPKIGTIAIVWMALTVFPQNVCACVYVCGGVSGTLKGPMFSHTTHSYSLLYL